MGEKEIAVKKYVGKLSDEEREQLNTLIYSGTHPARKLLKARILLNSSEVGGGWSDSQIAEELNTSGCGRSDSSAIGGRWVRRCVGLLIFTGLGL